MDNMVLPTAAAAPTVQAAQCRWQGIQRITDTQVYETAESSGPSVYTRRWVPVATISLLCTIHLTRPPIRSQPLATTISRPAAGEATSGSGMRQCMCLMQWWSELGL